VSRLIRTRFGAVAMPARIKRGQTLELTAEEVQGVLAAAGMRGGGGQPRERAPGKPSQPQQGRGPRPPRQERAQAPDRQLAAKGGREAVDESVDAVEGDADHVIEPGNSAAGAPTHANRSVKSFFAREHRPQHARPQGAGAPGPGKKGRRGKGGAGYAQGGPPRHGAAQVQRGSGAPHGRTTLTIPGGVPAGLPGTGGGEPRRKGPPGPPHGQGAPGAGPQGKRGRNRHRRGGKPQGPREARDADNRGNEAPRAVEPALVDDDIGNR
jgi:23S rRNA pseudouridine2605 synthase